MVPVHPCPPQGLLTGAVVGVPRRVPSGLRCPLALLLGSVTPLLLILLSPCVGGAKSPSCHEVRTSFQIRQIGPLKLVPEVPAAESDLQICHLTAPTCCTKKMEEFYQAAVRRELVQSIRSLNFELKFLIVDHITEFQEAFESMVRFAVNHTNSLFESAYRGMAREAVEPVKELYTDVSLYILGAETTVGNAALRFFDSLFPLVYSRLINPGIIDLSEEYTECLRLTRQDINPFGQYYKAMIAELSKSLWASRVLSQALNMGIEVINLTEHVTITKECSRALVKMQYCPHCQGLTLIRPCVGYCLNVMRGCMASVAELDSHWRDYIATLEYLSNEIAGSHGLEQALLGIRSVVNEAILYAQLNGPQLSATVDKVCGHPEERAVKSSPDIMVQREEEVASESLAPAHSYSATINNKRSSLPLKASRNDKPRSLKKISREFISSIKRLRTFYASIAERLCDGDLVVRDSSTCWNGQDVVESYTNRVVSNGLKAQINNPEMKVRGPDLLITNMIDKLHYFTQIGPQKKKTKLEKLSSTEDGSGDGHSEAEENSGDCDDEDGCQGSGDKVHRTDPKTGRKAYGDDINEQVPVVNKTDNPTRTSTTKSTSKHKIPGNNSNRVSNSSFVFMITVLVCFFQYLG